jgi:glucokinase
VKYTIGLDLGGTKIAGALVNSRGQILDSLRFPLNLTQYKKSQASQAHVLDLMTQIVLDFKRRHPHACTQDNFLGIGLASAGPMNVEQGILINPVNFPGWKKVPLVENLKEKLREHQWRCPLYFQNDAVAAAWAENWIGGAQKLKSFAVITVGTGIGTGVILNGKPCQTLGAGSEFGHLILNLDQAKKQIKELPHSTVEGIASGTALIRRARNLGFRGTSVEEMMASRSKSFSPLFEDMAWALAGLFYNLSIGFHLQKIFISGGLIKIQKAYLPDARKHYRSLVREFNPLFECPIELARTKNQAGVIGAAYLPWHAEKRNSKKSRL